MRSLEDMTPEERVEEFKKTEWSLVLLEGYKLGSDELIQEYAKMAGNIDFVVFWWFDHHGWDPDRSRKVSEEFIGVMH